MSGRARIGGALLALTLLGACGDSGLTLFIDLRTDYRPGEEFVGVEVTADDGRPVSVPATGRDDYVRGVRVAQLDGLAAGSHALDVVLLDPAGEVLQRRRARATLVADLAFTVVVSRDCAGVVCDDELACVGGRCVSQECELDADECGPPVCEAAEECVAEVPDCVRPVCIGVACLWEVRDDACPAASRCHPTRGCEAEGGDAGRPATDAGRPATDAGRPGMDAGGTDAGGTDAGREDAGGTDAGGTDAGGTDAGAPDAGGCGSRADCPPDDLPAFSACDAPAFTCSTTGTQSRIATRYQCALRRCMATEELEERSCPFASDGRRCGDPATADCNACRAGACEPVADGTECLGGGLRGDCRAGACCFTCWTGTACAPPSTDTQCGTGGEACVDCAASGLRCVGGLCRE